jgi:PAS domain S-box-containing protein
MSSPRTDFTDSLADFVWKHNASPMCFVSTDGQILKANPAFADLLGYTTKELEQTTVRRITHPEDIDAESQMVDDILLGRIEEFRTDKRYISKTGVVLWIKLVQTLVVDRDTGEKMFFLSQKPIRRPDAPKEINTRSEAEEEDITVGDVSKWLKKNFAKMMPIYTAVGFVLFAALKYFIEYFTK